MRTIASRLARLAPLLLAWSLAGCRVVVVMPAAESGQASPAVSAVTATRTPLAAYTPGSGGVVVATSNGAAPTGAVLPTASAREGQPTSTIVPTRTTVPTRTPTNTPAATPMPTTVLTAGLQGKPAYQDGAWRLTFAWSGAGGVVIELYRQGEAQPFRQEEAASSPYELILGEAGTYTWKVLRGNQVAEGAVALVVPTAVPTQGSGPQPLRPTSPPQPTAVPPQPGRTSAPPPTNPPQPTAVPPTEPPQPTATRQPTEPPPTKPA